MKKTDFKFQRPKWNTTLKGRILVAFFAIILIPVILTGFIFYFFTNHRLQSIGEQYGIENPTYENLYNSSLLVSKKLDDNYQMIKTITRDTPEKLEDNAYLNRISDVIREDDLYLVVKKDNEICYNGSDDVSDSVLLDALPLYGDRYANSDSAIYIQAGERSMVKQLDFYFSDGSQGSIYIVAKVSRMTGELKRWMTDMILVVIMVLVVTSFIMCMWIYYGVITPINQLKKATQNIKEGNLDFTVEGNGVREVNELCSDFEEMRLRLRESAEEKVETDIVSKELVSNISHDLKTPITAVKGYVEGIMDGVADTPEKMDRYIHTIYNKAIEMDRLINELTFYSKIDTNRIPYTFVKLSVAGYFGDCADELELDLKGRHVEFTYFNYMPEDAIIIADPEQLKRVINNIVNNSVKYMDKIRKVINLRVRDVGDFIQVEIEDNGKGIEQKNLAKIFDRFYRTDASRNSTQGGSGIGLSIVRKILEDHGGKVWATSREGVGTVMYFVLRKYQEVPVNESDTDH